MGGHNNFDDLPFISLKYVINSEIIGNWSTTALPSGTHLPLLSLQWETNTVNRVPSLRIPIVHPEEFYFLDSFFYCE